MQIATSQLFSFLNKNFKTTHHSRPGLDSITQIALVTISVIVSSRYLYSYMNEYFTSKPAVTNPPSSPSSKIVHILRENGVHLEEDAEENSNIFICSNKSFAHIDKVAQKLPEHQQRRLGYFYYSPEKRSICCDFSSDYGIAYPKGSEIGSLLKASRSRFVEEHPPLLLTNGSYCSEKEFIEHPLFRNTLEKYSVFRELCRISSESHFEEDYQYFLTVIRSDNTRWAEAYRSYPSDLAYTSLYAYLNGDITKEELFIVHMLASAFLESANSADYVVLSQENVRAHLQEYDYLSEQNISQNFYCLRNLDKKSLIEKTAIFYQSRQDGDLAAYSTITSQGGANPPGVKNLRGYEQSPLVEIFFFPPWLCKRLYSELYPNHSPPVEHEEFFGYRARVDDLISGRPISYASPLFYLPNAHNIKGTQLSVTAHDILYHCLLDWQHPHTHNLIKLGQKTKSFGRENLELIVNILDRPLIGSSLDQDTNIADHIKKYSFIIKKLSEKKQAMFFVYCKEVFGESVIDKIFSTEHFEQKFRP